MLDLKSNSIGDAGGKIFYDIIPAVQPEPETLSWIKYLDLSDNAIGDDGVLNITNCLASRRRFVGAVERVSFERNDISDDGARRALNRIHKLERLIEKPVCVELAANPRLSSGFLALFAIDGNAP